MKRNEQNLNQLPLVPVPIKKVFQASKEVDKGQTTNNPHILASRFINSGKAMDLNTINSILAYNNICINQEELDYLLSIKPVELSNFPLPKEDETVISLIGPGRNKVDSKRVRGVYVIENSDGSKRYVGSSSALGTRIRYYTSKKGLAEKRPIAKALLREGIHNFKVSVCLVLASDILKLNTKLSIKELTLALEQLTILNKAPSLNVLTVVNSSPSIKSTYVQKKLPVFIYDTNNKLVYKAESRTEMENETGITADSMNKNVKSGKPMYGLYVLKGTGDNNLIPSMSVEEFRNELKYCRRNRAKLRDYSNRTNNMTPVKITDLETGNKFSFISKRKAFLFTTQYPVDRQVSHLECINKKLPFTTKAWLFENSIIPQTSISVIEIDIII